MDSRTTEINRKLDSGNLKEAITLIQSFAYECGETIFSENCVKWMQHCCMVDEKNTQTLVRSLKLISELCISATKYSGLGGSIANSVIPRFIDAFIKKYSKYEEGWVCLESLLWNFNGPFAQKKDVLAALMKKIIYGDKKITKAQARCYGLLPSAGGGGANKITHKAMWTVQFKSIIEECHGILNHLFKDIQELRKYSGDNSVVNADASFDTHLIYFHNLCLVLQNMCLGRFPGIKSFHPSLVLNLVCRGLLVTQSSLGGEQLATSSLLRAAIPEIHVCLLKTLSATIVLSKGAILPFSFEIIGLLKQCIQSRPSESERLAMYSCLVNWLVVSKGSAHSEAFEETLTPTLLQDIEPLRIDAPSKVVKNVKTGKSDNCTEDVNRREKLCFAALETLRLYINHLGPSLSPKHHMIIQQKIVNRLFLMERESQQYYETSAVCRKAIYSLLTHLCLEPSPRWPPPTQYAIHFLKKGRNDPNPMVAETCSSLLSTLDRIIHPEFRVGSFPIDYKNVIDEFTAPNNNSLIINAKAAVHNSQSHDSNVSTLATNTTSNDTIETVESDDNSIFNESTVTVVNTLEPQSESQNLEMTVDESKSPKSADLNLSLFKEVSFESPLTPARALDVSSSQKSAYSPSEATILIQLSPCDSEVEEIPIDVEMKEAGSSNENSQLTVEKSPTPSSQDSSIKTMSPSQEVTALSSVSPPKRDEEESSKIVKNVELVHRRSLRSSSSKEREIDQAKPPKKRLVLDQLTEEVDVSTPMRLRSGSALTPKTRRREGSVSSMSSQNSRRRGPPSPVSDIGDELMATLVDTIQVDD